MAGRQLRVFAERGWFIQELMKMDLGAWSVGRGPLVRWSVTTICLHLSGPQIYVPFRPKRLSRPWISALSRHD